jgi:chromosome segregation ATPase
LQELFRFYREKEEGKSKEMNASFSALKLHFQQTDDAVQKLCGSRVATMCQEMDELQRNIQKVQKGQAANEIHLNRTAGEVDTLRASIVNFRRYLGVTNESDVSDLDILGNLNSLKEAAHKTTLQLRKTEVLSSELQQALQRIGDLEAITPKLQASSKAFAEQLGSRLETVEVILHESAEALKSHTDLSAFLNSESRARQQDKVLLQAQLDNQLKQHERTTERLLVLEGLLDELKGLERSLENQLITANGELRSLRDGVDLTHEYWKGLTKGVQRTHRSVVTEGDLLPLRSSPTRMLPSLSPH